MNKQKNIAAWGMMTCAAALLSAASAQAQSATSTNAPAAQAPTLAPTDSPADGSGRVEDVIVTANRRETNLQRTPVTVSAVTSNTIAQLQPRNIGELTSVVPNFSFGQASVNRAASFALRGVAQNESNIYMDQPVGVIVDDFVMPNTMSQLFDTFDIDRVEVLRGPQGTLFGKNTTAGAIVVTTKRPVFNEFFGEAQATVGSYGTIEARGAINIPLITDQLALRVVGSYVYNDGYYRNSGCWGPIPNIPANFASGCGDGHRVGGQNVSDFRAKLAWKPTSDLSVLVQYQRARDRSEVVPILNLTPAGTLWAINRVNYTQPTGDPLNSAVVYPYDDRLFKITDGATVDLDTYLGTVNWKTLGGTVTSTTGYQKQNSYLPSPWGTSGLLNDNVRADNRQTFQQEVRFASAWHGPFQLVVGGFYQHNNIQFCSARVLGIQDAFGLTSPYGAYRDNPQVLCNNQRGKAYAGFADVTFNITDRLSIQGGFRETHEEKVWTGRPLQFIQLLKGVSDPTFTWNVLGNLMDAGDFSRFTTLVSSDKHTWNEPTYRANIAFQATDSMLLYATYSHGFRSGAYNDSTGSGGGITTLGIQPTQPEYANNYEAGLKLDFLDHRARINIAAFNVDYTDMQRSLSAQLPGPNGTTIVQVRYFNAAQANVKGIEFEGTLIPVDALELRLTGGYLDGGYKSFLADTNADGIVDTDLTNRKMNNAPPFHASISVTYRARLGDHGSLRLTGIFEHQDKTVSVYSQVAQIYDTYLDERDLFNATITYENPAKTFSLQLVARNITNVRYKTWAIPAGTTAVIGGYAAPRYLGINVGTHF
jgi:iron complex outermembrane receptor protein